MRNPLTICEVHLQFAESAYICGFRIQILRIPLIFANSTYILRNPLTVAESRTSYICWLRNPQQNKCADKIYLTGICMRNPWKFSFVESTYILEHIFRLVFGIQEHTDIKLFSYPVHSLAS